MKYKKVLIIVVSVVFFFTALTLYLNRVVFPQLIKKIAVERIEAALKRKVEIGSIHFNWVRGFIIDKIKIYERNPKDGVFAQAQQVSFGVLFFPGFKHYRITIPFINVRSPSVHLIRIAKDTWNFSDIYTAPPSTAASTTTAKSQKPSAVEIAWSGITISDGKFLVDDASTSVPWSEYFDNINLKLTLSYQGISYDFTADIPNKRGFIGATVYYQPFTKDTRAQIHLKNIDTASYLSLVDIPGVHIDSGIIKAIDLNINYSQTKTSAQGNVLMKNLDLSNHDQSFKGDIEIHDLDAQYQNGDINARGQMSLTNVQTTVPDLSAGGSVQTKVNDFELTKDNVIFLGSLHAQNIFVKQKDRQVQANGVILDNIRVKKDKNGVYSIGAIATKGLFIQWPGQRLQGDLTLKSVSMRMTDENNIQLQGGLQADNFSTSLDDKSFSSHRILLENVRLNITDQKNVALTTQLSLDGMNLVLGKIFLDSDSIHADKLSFDLNDDMMKVSTILDFSKAKLGLGTRKTIEANPQLELTLQMPVKHPQALIYKGSITLSDGLIRGLGPVESLDNVELDADFQNDEATINALSANMLNSNVRVNGTVRNFKSPILNITAEADELDLTKIKDLMPELVDKYGLSFDGMSAVKVKFDGLLSDPLDGNIWAKASFKGVNISSSKLHQRIKNITGNIETTADSLSWHDFTATYQGQQYTLTGSLHHFKYPQILTSLNGPNLELKADLAKHNERITINNLTGKYLNAAFDSKGIITLGASGPIFDINSNVSLLLEDLIKEVPIQEKKTIQSLNPSGLISMRANVQGTGLDWKNYHLDAAITSPTVRLGGYKLTDMKIGITQAKGQVKNLTFDGKLYEGQVHAVGSLDLLPKTMPYDLAFNIDNTDLHQLKIDSPLKMDEIDGKFFLTLLAHGTIADFKNSLHATGSLAIRDGFLADFNLFRGLLSVLNDALRLGQVTITDVEANFTIDNQKINTDNLRLKGPTIVLLGKGWVNFNQLCDLDMTVDLSSGVVPDIAHDVLNTLDIRIYDKISNPKFKRKISVPQVINSLLKNLLQ